MIPSQPANPTGFVPTQKQIDESFKESYWSNAIRYALEYYVAGRFAVHAQVLVSPNLLHHAVELLIKANLSRNDSPTDIRKYGHRNSYGHSLGSAWQEFRRRDSDPTLAEYDSVITELDKFEDIRYPDKLVDNGAMINIELIEDSSLAVIQPGVGTYKLSLPKIDRLTKLLFDRSGINPEVFRLLFEQKYAAAYFTLNNATPLR